MVVAADLERSPKGNVIVGYETARVCNMAARLYRTLPDAYIVATAGVSPKFNVPMGDGPMRTYLERSDVPAHRIYTPLADSFRTAGEMQTLTRFMWEKIQKNPDDTFEIYLVARWWHYPRARLLLRSKLEPWQRTQVTVRAVPVRSTQFLNELPREILAFVRNIPDLFTSHDLEDCMWCGTQDCYEIGHRADENGVRTFGDQCHRCKSHPVVVPFKQAI